jgi:hypothetical protein
MPSTRPVIAVRPDHDLYQRILRAAEESSRTPGQFLLYHARRALADVPVEAPAAKRRPSPPTIPPLTPAAWVPAADPFPWTPPPQSPPPPREPPKPTAASMPKYVQWSWRESGIEDFDEFLALWKRKTPQETKEWSDAFYKQPEDVRRRPLENPTPWPAGD